MKTVTLELDDTVYSLLEVLTRGEAAPVPDVEGVIVSDRNEVLISSGLKNRLRIVAPPTDAP